MIHYDPHHWRSHLLDWRGSVLREILARMTVCVVWSIAVVAWNKAAQHHQTWEKQHALGRFPVPGGAEQLVGTNRWCELAASYPLSIPLHGHTLIGVALGLLLVFRTNSSYDRFWEGRKLWGALVNDTRNVGRLATTLLNADAELMSRTILWTTLFPWAVKGRLQGKKELGPHAARLPQDEVLKTQQAQHVALAVSRRITETVAEARRRGLITDIQQLMIDNVVSRLLDSLGACERIHLTPMPFAYMVHLRRALIIYLVTLPMALVESMGWATIAAQLLISYVMLGVEEIGVEIEDPFGDDENDLPLKSICETIDNNLVALLPGAEVRPAADSAAAM
jgi:putative membrane protein